MAAVQLIAILITLISQGVQVATIVSLLNNITNGAWLLEQARKWGFHFDKILISLADKVYYYFQKIVGGTLITPSVTEDIMSRIYIVVGIFIFFKLAIVAIKYMTNPEMFLDDKLGAQTLVKRVIIGSIVILLTPFIFSKATELQKYIIEDRVIEKVILPRDAYAQFTRKNNQGKELAMLVFNGFFGWNEAVPKESANRIYNSYERIKAYNDLSSFDDTYMTEKVGNEYVISYIPIISTLAVGYLLYMLIKYALEVAFRAFKLVFMQLISPFVIVNYMLDPSQEEVMKKWVNTTVSTYLLIFIRVITLCFATLICYYLTNGIPINGEETSLLNEPDALLKALIVLALFVFLKDLPKVISEVFGYNLQENETITSIMNQGVGAIKGFAMGKVGLSYAKQQMGFSIASSALGTASSAVSSGLGAKAQGANKMGQFASALGSVGGGMASTTSMMGSVLSSSMGSTVLGPITQAGNVAASTDRMYNHSPVSFGKKLESQEETNKNGTSVTPKLEANISSSRFNDFTNNILNSSDGYLQQYIDGNKVDLEDRANISVLDSSGSFAKVNNPIVREMSKTVYESLPSKENITVDSITSQIKDAISKSDLSIDPKQCNISDLPKIMDQVYYDIEASRENLIDSVNLPKSTTDKNGLENVIIPKDGE